MNEKTKPQIEERISLLEDEIIANEEENRMFQNEIDRLTQLSSTEMGD